MAARSWMDGIARRTRAVRVRLPGLWCICLLSIHCRSLVYLSGEGQYRGTRRSSYQAGFRESAFHGKTGDHLARFHKAARVGNLREAERLLGEFASWRGDVNVVAFNAIIHAAALTGNTRVARRWYAAMEDARCQPDTSTFNSLINAAAKAKDMVSARHWFAQMRRCEISPDRTTYQTLLNAACVAAGWKDIQNQLQAMREAGFPPDAVSYTTLIRSSNRLCYMRFLTVIEMAETFWEDMLDDGVQPSRNTVTAMITAAGQARDKKAVSKWMTKMRELEMEPDTVSYGAALGAFTAASEVDRAMDLLEALRERALETNIFCYAPLVNHFAQNDKTRSAEYLLDCLSRDGHRANVILYNNVLEAYARQKPVATVKILKTLRQMVHAGVVPSAATMHIVGGALSKWELASICNDLGLDPKKGEEFTVSRKLTEMKATIRGDKVRSRTRD